MGSGNGASLIAKDLIDSEDPEDTLFCREAAFVAINKRLSVRRSACIKYKHVKMTHVFHEQGGEAELPSSPYFQTSVGQI